VTAPAKPATTNPIPAACCLELGEIAILFEVLQDPQLDPGERAAIRAHIRIYLMEEGCGVAPQHRAPGQAGTS
jgi:hypothetical protein